MTKPRLLSSFPSSPLSNESRTSGDGARGNLTGNKQDNGKGSWSGANETPLEEISAYFKLESEWFTYYCQKLAVTIGRRVSATDRGAKALLPPCKTVTLTGDHSDSSPLGSAPAGTEAPSTVIDVDLGQLKSISRLHARIQYNEDNSCFTLAVLGRNGAWVDDGWYESGMKVRLTSGSRIQIATCVFYFVLPLPLPHPRPRSFSLLPVAMGLLLLWSLYGTPGVSLEHRPLSKLEPTIDFFESKFPREHGGNGESGVVLG
ncbi:Pre-rRNA-processing protein fhl1 [Ceratobasidium sp. 395]|nr:Pre-rRNA-processing protein fhl1 [Ceratobasidium sp. 395]